MDKALTWHTGIQGSNPDTSKVYRAPILLGTPAMCTLSLTMPVITCSSMNTCHRGGKKTGMMGNILAGPSVKQNTNVRAMYGKKGVKTLPSAVTILKMKNCLLEGIQTMWYFHSSLGHKQWREWAALSSSVHLVHCSWNDIWFFDWRGSSKWPSPHSLAVRYD